MVRESLAATLSASTKIDVVGTASSGREALDKTKKLDPQVILMDIRMPAMDGIKSCRLIKKAMPDVHVIIISAFDDDLYITEAIEAGASGYMLKSMPMAELVRAINLTVEGKSMLHPSVTRKLISEFRKMADEGGQKFKLTDRELEVLQLLAYGNTNKEIANTLSISQQTVKSHVIHIFQKLGASDRTEAVAIALRKGIVE
jgi:DNA-binding NarL/FixJ family response regulator